MTLELQRDILRRLQSYGVPFVVVGGHAVAYHGYPRGTEDVDVVWLRSLESEAALVRALDDLKATRFGDDVDPATGIEQLLPVTASFVSVNHLMMLQTEHGFLDLFDYVPGYPDADVAKFFEESLVAEDGLRYPSLPWLRRMKEAAGRPKDRLDLEEIDKVNE